MKEKIFLFLFVITLAGTVLCALTYGVLQILILSNAIGEGAAYDNVLLTRNICFDAFLVLGVLAAISGFLHFKIIKK